MKKIYILVLFSTIFVLLLGACRSYPIQSPVDDGSLQERQKEIQKKNQKIQAQLEKLRQIAKWTYRMEGLPENRWDRYYNWIDSYELYSGIIFMQRKLEIAGDDTCCFGGGQTLEAIDANTGKSLWKMGKLIGQENDAVSKVENSVYSNLSFDELEYLSIEGNSAIKIDLRTRETIWKYTSNTGNPFPIEANKHGILIKELHYPPDPSKLSLLNSETGTLIWSKQINYLKNELTLGEFLYVQTITQVIKLDLKTGQEAWTYTTSADRWSIQEPFTVHNTTVYFREDRNPYTPGPNPGKSIVKITALDTETEKEKWSKERETDSKDPQDKIVDILWSAIDIHQAYLSEKKLNNKKSTWWYVSGLQGGGSSYVAQDGDMLYYTYDGNNNPRLEGFNLEKGELIFEFPMPQRGGGEGIIEDGIIYTTDTQETLLAIDGITGKAIWQTKPSQATLVEVGIYQNKLYAIDQESSIFKFDRENGRFEKVYSSAVKLNPEQYLNTSDRVKIIDNMFIFIDENGTIHGISIDTFTELWTIETGPAANYKFDLENGLIYMIGKNELFAVNIPQTTKSN